MNNTINTENDSTTSRPRKIKKTISKNCLVGIRRGLEKSLSAKEISQAEEISLACTYKLINAVAEGNTDV
jgi:hypothetical protein